MIVVWRVQLDGEDFDGYTEIEVESGGPEVTARLVPIDPYWAPEIGAEISIWMGARTTDGDSLWPLVEKGKVVGSRRVTAAEDTLEITIDATDFRFRRAVPEIVTSQGDLVRELLAWIYVDQLGFAGVVTNLPEFRVERFEAGPEQSWHDAAKSVVGAFEPLFFVEPVTDVLWILDTRRPLPPGWPARELGVRDVLTVTADRAPVDVVNWVRIEYLGYYTAPAGRTYQVLVERSRPGDQTPDGQYRSRTRERVRQTWEVVPGEPDRMIREVRIGTKVENFDAENNRLSTVETEYTWVGGTGDALPESQSTTKWGVITLETDRQEFMKVRHETRDFTWSPALDSTGRRELLAEYGRVEGLVLDRDRIPLDEANREGLTGRDGGQLPVWRLIEHEYVSISEIRENLVEGITIKIDDLNPDRGAVITQEPRVTAGTTSYTPEQPVLTYDHQDTEASIARWGLRPRRVFDAKPYGLDLGIEIVEQHVFASPERRVETASIRFLLPDASVFRGQLWLWQDRGGNTRYWIATNIRHSGSAATGEAVTQIAAIEGRVEGA